MSLLSRINQPDDVPLHSSGLAGGTNQSSFEERQRAEQQRQRVKAYSHSRLGTMFVARGEYVRKPLGYKISAGRKYTRQEMNAGGFVPDRGEKSPTSRQETNAKLQINRGRFHEPPARDYNPYA